MIPGFKIRLCILFLLTSVFSTNGQNKNKYAAIDTLISTNSVIDAMTAQSMLKENFKKDTIDPEYWLRYSKACYIFYDYAESKSAINKAISLAPENSLYHFEKGLLLNRIGETDNSLKCLEKAVQLKPVGEYYYWKGIVNQQLNNLKEAEDDYKKAMKSGFETPELHNNYGILLMNMGNEDYSGALDHLNKAIKLDSTYAQAYSARSKIYLILLNFDSACNDLKMARQLGYNKMLEIPDSVCNGTFTSKYQFAAEVCAVNNAFGQAIMAYTKLIDNNIISSDIFLNRGYCNYKLKNYSDSEKDYLKALELPDPSKDLLYDNLSLLYYDQNNFMKSIEYSSKRIELNPLNHVPYIDRGLCYRKLKKYKEAEADFNKSLEIKPDFFRAFGYRSYLYFELGQLNEAYEDALRSVEINSKYGYGYLVLALVKQKLKMPDYCIDFYNAKKYGAPDADAGIKEFCK